jgi:hypothetical protein
MDRACEYHLLLDFPECLGGGKRATHLLTVEVVNSEDGRQTFALCPVCTHQVTRGSDPRIRVIRVERLK